MSLFVFIWFIIYLFIIWLLFGSHPCGFMCKRNKRDVGVQNRHVILASCAALPHLYSYAPLSGQSDVQRPKPVQCFGVRGSPSALFRKIYIYY
jgi:hypothetical protein